MNDEVLKHRFMRMRQTNRALNTSEARILNVLTKLNEKQQQQQNPKHFAQNTQIALNEFFSCRIIPSTDQIHSIH